MLQQSDVTYAIDKWHNSAKFAFLLRRAVGISIRYQIRKRGRICDPIQILKRDETSCYQRTRRKKRYPLENADSLSEILCAGDLKTNFTE